VLVILTDQVKATDAVVVLTVQTTVVLFTYRRSDHANVQATMGRVRKRDTCI
jgi:hypothetical protein